MDGRGRPVKREEELDNPRRDAQGNLNDFEGVREAQGSRRPSTTMGTDSALPFEQMARLDGRQEQDEMLQRRRNGQRRGSRTNLEEVIETSAAIPASSFLYALQQQRQQQMQQQMTAGGLKTFPSLGPTSPESAVDWNQLPSSFVAGDADAPPAEPERPIASRGRRPSIGQLF
ncbi:uncharacterized protein ACA1_065200 [Acanthamoeba castellanii str. Neff]|uniref:Uncharacterized protein n=1 Tax=Acanthamoeba castellanii (strain ATCC 30010 / Neff) TaxID=1257118 RepID=L8H027_ACACF|nr:uncharacterized protein ACA1_065200 [Acanthamoeba castellanii str. Neff]ELR17731.1 hypothetical protein ACA1_065200 [Acanthamoeba castellanii str. Neff]